MYIPQGRNVYQSAISWKEPFVPFLIPMLKFPTLDRAIPENLITTMYIYSNKNTCKYTHTYTDQYIKLLKTANNTLTGCMHIKF